MTTPLPLDWSIYEQPLAAWPRSRDRVFMAEAVQQLGYLVHEQWQGEEPRWANQQPWPLSHSHTEAFRNGDPIVAVYSLYEPLVRSILSPAAYQAARMRDEVDALEQPGEVDPHEDPQEKYRLSFAPSDLDRAIARAADGSDASDPVTEEHWAYVWSMAAERQANYAAAVERLPLVSAKLLDLAQRGSLSTYARPVDGGPAERLPEDVWEIDSALFRMASCGIKLEDPLAAAAPITHFIFVDRLDLHQVVGRVAAQKRPSQSVFKPHMSMSERDRLKEEALAWLLKKVEDTRDEPWWDKELYHSAMMLEPGLDRLPETDWISNWRDVYAIYEHIGRRGNRPAPPPGWSVHRSRPSSPGAAQEEA